MYRCLEQCPLTLRGEDLANIRNVKRKKLVVLLLTCFMAVAALVGVVGEVRDWWSWFSDNQTSAVSTREPSGSPEGQPTAPAGAITPYPTETGTSAAESMLEVALTIPSTSERAKGLRTVATTGVAEFDYKTAISAGQSTPGTSSRAETLTFVALCAAQDGLFDEADEAASYIPSTTARSMVKNQILNIRHRKEVLGIEPSPGRPGWVNCR